MIDVNSEQQVVDCTYASGKNGCKGGLPSDAIKAIAKKTFGLNTIASYPYTSGTSTSVILTLIANFLTLLEICSENGIDKY